MGAPARSMIRVAELPTITIVRMSAISGVHWIENKKRDKKGEFGEGETDQRNDDSPSKVVSPAGPKVRPKYTQGAGQIVFIHIVGLSRESEHDMMWTSVGCWNQDSLAAWPVFSAAELGRGLYRKRYVLCVWVTTASTRSIYFSVCPTYLN